MTPAERFEALARAPLFAGLPEQILGRVAARAKPCALTVGARLLQAAVGDASLWVIVQGSMRLSLFSTAGREFVVAIAGRGDVLGELGESASSSADGAAPVATAQESTRLLRIAWRTLREEDPDGETQRRCNAALVARTRALLQLIEDLTLYPLDARLARLLARLHAHAPTQPAQRLHRFNQATLALMTNATRPKVNQHLRAFERLGAIELDGGVVRVRDLAALARIGQRAR